MRKRSHQMVDRPRLDDESHARRDVSVIRRTFWRMLVKVDRCNPRAPAWRQSIGLDKVGMPAKSSALVASLPP
jgi:hypothetical protein